jgi:hypothetical protein
VRRNGLDSTNELLLDAVLYELSYMPVFGRTKQPKLESLCVLAYNWSPLWSRFVRSCSLVSTDNYNVLFVFSNDLVAEFCVTLTLH